MKKKAILISVFFAVFVVAIVATITWRISSPKNPVRHVWDLAALPSINEPDQADQSTGILKTHRVDDSVKAVLEADLGVVEGHEYILTIKVEDVTAGHTVTLWTPPLIAQAPPGEPDAL